MQPPPNTETLKKPGGVLVLPYTVVRSGQQSRPI